MRIAWAIYGKDDGDYRVLLAHDAFPAAALATVQAVHRASHWKATAATDLAATDLAAVAIAQGVVVMRFSQRLRDGGARPLVLRIDALWIPRAEDWRRFADERAWPPLPPTAPAELVVIEPAAVANDQPAVPPEGSVWVRDRRHLDAPHQLAAASPAPQRARARTTIDLPLGALAAPAGSPGAGFAVLRPERVAAVVGRAMDAFAASVAGSWQRFADRRRPAAPVRSDPVARAAAGAPSDAAASEARLTREALHLAPDADLPAEALSLRRSLDDWNRLGSDAAAVAARIDNLVRTVARIESAKGGTTGDRARLLDLVRRIATYADAVAARDHAWDELKRAAADATAQEPAPVPPAPEAPGNGHDRHTSA